MEQSNHSNQNQNHSNKLIPMNRITTIEANYKSNEKIQMYVLWQILNKRYTIGSKLFFPDIESKLGVSKSALPRAKMFLEGAGVLVDDVIIADKIPNNLKERFGLIDEQAKPQN